MKKKILLIVVVIGLLFSLSSCYKDEENHTYSYKVITTSFTDEESYLTQYHDGSVNDVTKYDIRGVEYYYVLDELYLYSAYDNDVIGTTSERSNEICSNSYGMIHDGESFIMIHRNGLGTYIVVKYDDDFNIIEQSDNIEGVPVGVILYNDYLLVLNNDKDDSKNRYTSIMILNNDQLIVEDDIIVEDMIYGFHIEQIDNELVVYGHDDMDEEKLYISIINIDNQTQTTMEYNEDVFWVSNSIFTEGKQYVINDYSIIVIDQNFQIEGVYNPNKSVIDFQYINEDTMYILQGDFTSNEYEVVVVNNRFELIEIFPIQYNGTKPTRIIVD